MRTVPRSSFKDQIGAIYCTSVVSNYSETQILAASLVWPGMGYWPLFFEAMQNSVAHMRASLLPAMMVTTYGTATQAGLGHEAALAVQIVISLIAAGALAWLWSARISFDIKAAALAFAVLLVTPYAIYYELVFAIVGIIYLARAGALETRPAQLVAVLIWLAPAIGLLALSTIGFVFGAPLIAVAFALAAAVAVRQRTPVPR